MISQDNYSGNVIKEIRAGSRFETFKPRHNSQHRAWQALQTLAEQVIGTAPHILENEFPFSVGNIIVLRGKPGLGKTHLGEAFLNRILQRAPQLLPKLVLAKGDKFSTDYCCHQRPYGKASIIVIDDILSNEHGKWENSPCIVEWFGKFVTDVYDHRQLVIVTSNVPLFTKGGIMQHMPSVDKVGRVTSRLAEIVVNDYELDGTDFRAVIGRRRKPSMGLRVGPATKAVLPTQSEVLHPKTAKPQGDQDPVEKELRMSSLHRYEMLHEHLSMQEDGQS